MESRTYLVWGLSHEVWYINIQRYLKISPAIWPLFFALLPELSCNTNVAKSMRNQTSGWGWSSRSARVQHNMGWWILYKLLYKLRIQFFSCAQLFRKESLPNHQPLFGLRSLVAQLSCCPTRTGKKMFPLIRSHSPVAESASNWRVGKKGTGKTLGI